MTNKSILISLVATLCLIATLAALFVWLNARTEIQVYETRISPDGKWTAVVQMEVDSSEFVSDAVYTVRLKGPAQKDRQGDLVMNVPVNYPVPEPSIEWSHSKLVVKLANNQKYQYFVTPVNGIAVFVQQGGQANSSKDSAP